MAKNLENYRQSYEKGELKEALISKNPFDQFDNWFKAAENSEEVDEANAMTLTTVGIDGYPKGRVVLLKEYDASGFIFYTNYNSEKGTSIAANKNVSIAFFWPGLERQILIKGNAAKISEEKSKAYFNKRPRKSQLGALVSEQSRPVASRDVLEKSLEGLEEKYNGKEIPKPENWGGYKITPVAFEFWQGRPSRLHDRILYTADGSKWIIERLQP